MYNNYEVYNLLFVFSDALLKHPKISLSVTILHQ